MLLTIVVFLIILSVLVLIHEAGHFIVAKLFKIKVEEFGFGLPPRVFGIKRGETVYSINWLPIGGFVKLYGEDSAGGGQLKIKNQKSKIKNLDRTFFARPVWQRALVVFAGVFMNFALAVIIISFLFSVVGVPMPVKINIIGIEHGSPAEKSGLKTGDTIESVNNITMVDSNDLVSYAIAHLGEQITIKVKTINNKEEVVKVTPRKKYNKDIEGPIGISLKTITAIKKYPWYEAPFSGTWEALRETGLIVKGLGGFLSQLIFKGAVPKDVAGPVGIAQLTGFVCRDWAPCLSFTGLLSLNLAILNILPIPALDGGRLFFIIIEAVTRRKVNQKVESYAHAIGMAVLLTLIALITLHDIIRVVTGQPILPK